APAPKPARGAATTTAGHREPATHRAPPNDGRPTPRFRDVPLREPQPQESRIHARTPTTAAASDRGPGVYRPGVYRPGVYRPGGYRPASHGPGGRAPAAAAIRIRAPRPTAPGAPPGGL